MLGAPRAGDGIDAGLCRRRGSRDGRVSPKKPRFSPPERDHASVLAAMDREQMQTVFRRARELHALEMSDAGLTYTKIGELIGRLDDGEPLSGAGVSFLVEKARRRRQWHIERGRPIEVLPH
jgi:hypothetical protein